VQEVLGLSAGQEDFIASLKAIMRHVPVVPHLTAGLLGGRISGETDAVDILSSLGIRKIVVNVFIPTPGTPLATASPPPATEVVRLLNIAREKIGSVYLGCMRPAGEYREKLDVLSLGIADRIVMPSREARQKSPDAKAFYECCAL
jgi:uncharacterized radical SAM superfamily protein